MKIEEEYFGNVIVLKIKGNMMGGVENLALSERVKELLGDGIKSFVFDMSKIKWMNVSGLGVMMKCLTEIKNKGGQLRLANISDNIRSLFIITKMTALFDCDDSVAEAVEYCLCCL